MTSHSDTVAHDMFALLHEAAAPVVTRWIYRSDDPFAVTVEIQTRGNRCVDWVLARELLMAGLIAPGGIGDIRVRPATVGRWEVTLVEICSPDGHAVLEVDRELLRQFVKATTDIVPLGSEAPRAKGGPGGRPAELYRRGTATRLGRTIARPRGSGEL